jgi:hypothetical protein
MASPLRTRIAVTVTTIAVAVVCVVGAVGVVAPAGCTGNCRSNCPNISVYIGNLDNFQLAINDVLVDGPACPPPYSVSCAGDGVSTNCTHVTLTGAAQGYCDVLIVFADRPPEIVHTQFGPPVQQGCCTGYTIVGDSVFIIPDNPDAGISGADGSTEAVTIVVDGGTTDAADGGTTSDAGDAASASDATAD